MGKTAVLLAVAHSDPIVDQFGENVHWVPCEQATSVELLVNVVAKSLNIKNPSNDPLQDIRALLRTSRHPRLLIFDNLETPLHIEQKQGEVEDILHMVASSPKVSILVTMRGQSRPCPSLRWTQPALLPLQPLTLDAARHTFLDISSETQQDASLDELLGMVDYVPLAVVIMASLAQLGETPQKLIGRFRKEGSSLLHQGDDRLHSIDCSVLISITSPPMKSNPEALTLLQILSMLPGGASINRLSDIAPDVQNPEAALVTLKRVSLVYVTPDDIVRVLSPISSYIIHNHPLVNPHRQHLYESYYRLAKKCSCSGTTGFVQIKLEMANEEANMDAILLHALEHDQSRDAVEASKYYTWFLHGHIPRTDVIAEAISVAERLKYLDLLADCLFVRASIDYFRSNPEQATRSFEQARKLYGQLDNQQQEAQCLRHLGDAYRMKSSYKEARSHLEEARRKFEGVSTLGTAQCLWSLGNILIAEDRYEGAYSLLEEAKSRFEEIGHTGGTAQCLQGLSRVLVEGKRFEEAKSHLEEAKGKFEEISQTVGVAECLRSLGVILIEEERYVEALSHLEEAKLKFEEVGYSLGTAQCLGILSEILVTEHRYEEATSHLEEAKCKFEETGHASGIAECLLRLGKILIAENRNAEARLRLEKAKGMFGEINEPLGTAECIESLGNILVAENRLKEARACLEEAKSKFEGITQTLGASRCLQSLGGISRKEGLYGEAQILFQQAMLGYESVGNAKGIDYCRINIQSCKDDEPVSK